MSNASVTLYITTPDLQAQFRADSCIDAWTRFDRYLTLKAEALDMEELSRLEGLLDELRIENLEEYRPEWYDARQENGACRALWQFS